MIRTFCFALLGLVMFCGTSNADFIVDDFVNIATSGGGEVISNSSTDSNITVEITDQSAGGVLQSNADNYGFLATAAGQFFTLTYDFGGVEFQDLPNVFNNTFIRALGFPVATSIGDVSDWTFEASTDGGTSFDTLGVELAGETDVQLRFTFDGNGIGVSSLTFGGAATPLVAVPEPTGVLMLGSIVALGYVRRRRRS